MPSFISQNRKIAISALAIFVMSFSAMLMFLQGPGGDLNEAHTNVLGAHGGETSGHVEEDTHESSGGEYLKILEVEESLSFFVADPEGVMTFVSDEFCKQLGEDREGIDGESFFDHINSNDLPDFIVDYAKLLHEMDEMEGVGPYRMLMGGNEKIFIFNFLPIVVKDELTEVIIVPRDITEQVEELNGSNKTWMKHLYPKIETMKDGEIKLSFKRV